MDDQRQQSLAYIWLFSAGIDPEALDTNGDTLVRSLVTLLVSEHRQGVQEAALAFTHGRSGKHRRVELEGLLVDDDDCDDPTGTYEAGELAALLTRVG